MNEGLVIIIILAALIIYVIYRRKKAAKLKAKGKTPFGKTYLGCSLPLIIFIIIVFIGMSFFIPFLHESYKNAEIKYSTVQNWYAGDKEGNGGIYNFVTKRGNCVGYNSKISWTQVEAGSAITWKYPSCNLIGDNSEGAFYSVALTNNRMQADTGTKMIHIGKNTKSTIISKGISTDQSSNTYRGLVKVMPGANNAKNFSQCDSMLVGGNCSAHTYPYIDVKNKSAKVEHEATTSKISDDQLFYLKSRGLDTEKSISLIVNGFCKDVFKKLPLEFSIEAVKLIEMKLENSVG